MREQDVRLDDARRPLRLLRRLLVLSAILLVASAIALVVLLTRDVRSHAVADERRDLIGLARSSIVPAAVVNGRLRIGDLATRQLRRAIDLLAQESPRLSPMVMLELGFLHERGRISQRPEIIYASLIAELDLALAATSFADVIEAAQPLSWTRDPFDRLIVANAASEGANLLTADELILANFQAAVW